MGLRIGLLVALLILFNFAPAKADPEECSSAIDSYNGSKSDLESALRQYTSCVDSSDGKDDCSSEFSSVSSAQDDFESAVSSYESDCG